jgi:hypothetical protein
VCTPVYSPTQWVIAASFITHQLEWTLVSSSYHPSSVGPVGNKAKKNWADLRQNRWYVKKNRRWFRFSYVFCTSVYSSTRWVNSCCIWDAHTHGMHVSCQFMPSFVGPLNNRRQLLADSRRNRWADEKPGGSWTVPGVPGWGREDKGERRETREREVERGERARGAFCGVERRRICFTLQRILAPICEI